MNRLAYPGCKKEQDMKDLQFLANTELFSELTDAQLAEFTE